MEAPDRREICELLNVVLTIVSFNLFHIIVYILIIIVVRR